MVSNCPFLFFFPGSSFSIWEAAEIGSDAWTLAETPGPCFPRFRHQCRHTPHQTCSWHWGLWRTLPGEAGLYARFARGPGSNVQGWYHSYCGVSELWSGQTSPQLTEGFFLQCWTEIKNSALSRSWPTFSPGCHFLDILRPKLQPVTYIDL